MTVLAMVLFAATIAEARPYVLEWDANTDGVTAGYKVYYGTAPGTYEPIGGIDVGNTTEFEVDLSPGQTYYFIVRAYNDNDALGAPSDELEFTVPGPAVISQPTDGDPFFDTTNNIQWNAVSGAETYYLWAGTTPGSQDLINSGEILATEFSAPTLPAATLVYATLWTKFSGSWYSTTSTFTTSAQARWLYPTNNAVGVTAQAFSWTSVPGAAAYYLWVGTTPNGNDVVNTGEIAQTQYTPALLPSGTTLYATIWTRVGSTWYSRQISFTTSPTTSWLYPGVNTTSVATTTPLQWNAVPGAQAYYLWIGSTPGTNNLVNTGEIQQVQYLASSLPAATTVYATIWVKHGGVWWGNAKTFTTSPATRWITPASAGTNLLNGTSLQWAPVTGAQSYYLWVGTTLDGQDVRNTGEIQVTQLSTSGMPSGQLLYANIWVRHANLWYSTRTTFTVTPAAASFVSPSQPTLAAGTPLQWTTVSGAQAYYLWIGTAAMTQNIVNTGEIQTTTYPSTSLPTNTTLHATIWTKLNGIWRSSATVFTIP